LRTQAHAGYYDVKKQNEIIKAIRTKFKGFFTGDYGLNRYASIRKNVISLPVEKGLNMEYYDAHDTLNKLDYAVQHYTKTDKDFSQNTKR
jgi:hypothetical protein